ncbi:MAG: phage holin family protein [Burkholderiales bacterium]|nr:phage holin family protein [Burkholderiales bacterium]MDE2567119.1 phage holin family protein [Burkholderiales bacterium]
MPAPDAAPPQPPPPGWLAALQDLARELPGLVTDRLDLLGLELRRAGLALAQIAALVVAAAVLGVTAWLALWAGIAGALVRAGLPWAGALLLVLLLNLAASAALLLRVRGLLPQLGLPATRRHLRPTPAGVPAPLPTEAPRAHEPRAEPAAR